MTDSISASAAIGRLAHQLHTLSQLSESLTYRLLELEERVVALDQLIQPLLMARTAESAQLGEDAERRLDDTAARLTRLESVLSSLEGFREEVATDDQLFLDEQSQLTAIDDDEVQEFPADDFDEDQRLIA